MEIGEWKISKHPHKLLNHSLSNVEKCGYSNCTIMLIIVQQMEIYNLINNITKSFIVTDTCSVVTEILLLHVSALLSFGLTTTGKKCEFCVPISLFVPTTEGQVYLYNKVK